MLTISIFLRGIGIFLKGVKISTQGRNEYLLVPLGLNLIKLLPERFNEFL